MHPAARQPQQSRMHLVQHATYPSADTATAFTNNFDPVYKTQAPQLPLSAEEAAQELERLLSRDNLVTGQDRLLMEILLSCRHPQLGVTAECLRSHPRLASLSPDQILQAAEDSALLRVDRANALVFPELVSSRVSLVFRDISAETTASEVWDLLKTQEQLLHLSEFLPSPILEMPTAKEEDEAAAEIEQTEKVTDSNDPDADEDADASNFLVARILAKDAAAIAAACTELSAVTATPDQGLCLEFADQQVAKDLAWNLRSQQLHGQAVNVRMKQEAPISRETLISLADTRHWAQPRRHIQAGRWAGGRGGGGRGGRSGGRGGWRSNGGGNGHSSNPHHHHHTTNSYNHQAPRQHMREHVMVVAQSEFPPLSDAVRMRGCGYGSRSFTLRPPAELRSLCEALPPMGAPQTTQEQQQAKNPNSEMLAVFEKQQRHPAQWKSDALQRERISNKLNSRPAAKTGTVTCGMVMPVDSATSQQIGVTAEIQPQQQQRAPVPSGDTPPSLHISSWSAASTAVPSA